MATAFDVDGGLKGVGLETSSITLGLTRGRALSSSQKTSTAHCSLPIAAARGGVLYMAQCILTPSISDELSADTTLHGGKVHRLMQRGLPQLTSSVDLQVSDNGIGLRPYTCKYILFTTKQ